jgi:hypothetical protein
LGNLIQPDGARIERSHEPSDGSCGGSYTSPGVFHLCSNHRLHHEVQERLLALDSLGVVVNNPRKYQGISIPAIEEWGRSSSRDHTTRAPDRFGDPTCDKGKLLTVLDVKRLERSIVQIDHGSSFRGRATSLPVSPKPTS